jgi:hypothetical protein
MAIAALAVVFIGCHSGGGSGSGAGSTTSAVTVGSMTKGSVVVNGVRFEDTAANITADDTPKTAAFLADGMVVKVKGTINDDGVTGQAQEIEVENEVRGAITAPKGTDTITVLNQTVLIDGGTAFPPGLTFGTLTAGDEVEVHGQRDAAGVIHATRVEKLGADASDQVRGPVTGVATGSFNIGSLHITFDGGTVIAPEGATFAEGDIVEVHLNGGQATRIEVEHAEDRFRPDDGQKFEVEGFVSQFGSLSGTFRVGDQEVDASGGSVRFEGGIAADLANDMRVEAEGHISGGILIATKIALKESIRIEANADADGSANVLGMTVKVTSKTTFGGGITGEGGIALNDGIRIRGFENNDGTSITAMRIDKQSNPVDGDKIILQGPVNTINAPGSTFKIMGVTVNAGSSISRPNDDSGSGSQTMPLGDFLSSLVENRTIVKARGTFSAGTLAAAEIELE